MIKEILLVLFFVSLISFGMYGIYLGYEEIHTYLVLKGECNQDMNKDLCFCDDGYCEVKYECKGDSSSTTTINGILNNTNVITGDCGMYEQRLCDIATKAGDKEWIWRYCK